MYSSFNKEVSDLQERNKFYIKSTTRDTRTDSESLLDYLVDVFPLKYNVKQGKDLHNLCITLYIPSVDSCSAHDSQII